METTALIADLGGTNARFALVEGDTVRDVRVMRATQYPGLAEIIAAYLAELGLERAPPRAAIAAASPMTGDHVAMTNLGWSFSIAEIAERFGFTAIQVINDFVAVALAVPEFRPEHLVKIGGGEPVAGETVGVLGPGTGLGVSTLATTATGRVALSGEGGHVTLSATDDREAAVIEVLRRRYAHVSAERVLSGMGLVNLYEAVATLEGEQPAQRDPSEVTDRAINRGDRHCRLALDLFFGFLGSVAGNLALTVGARGGVYIAGGIVPRHVDELMASPFRQRFEAKGRLSGYLTAIPTYLVVDPLPAMLGLKSAALAAGQN